MTRIIFIGPWLAVAVLLTGCGDRAGMVTSAKRSPAGTDAALTAVFETFPVPAKTALREHDNLLRAIQLLEDLAAKHPDHSGIRGDLLWAYIRLLDHEGRSDFGGEVCRTAALHLEQGVGLDNTLQMWARWRLQLYAHQYPLAWTAGGEAQEILTALGHEKFVELPGFDVGPARCVIHLSVGGPVDDVLIWDALHLNVGPPDDAAVHRHVTYTLGSKGRGDARVWYLRFHALNRTLTLRAYGATRPKIVAVLRQVREHAGDMIAAVHAGVR